MCSFKLNAKLQIGLWVVVFISLALYFLGKQIPQEFIQNFLQKTGPWAPIIFILSHQISYILAPISGYPFIIVGYFLFAEKVIVYIYLSALLGFTINFFIARKWGRPLVERFIGRAGLKKIDKLAMEYGVLALVALRLFQGGIGDFVSYAYGLTLIKFPTYFTISALGALPGQIIWYWFAAKSGSIEQFLGVNLMLTLAGTVIFLLGIYFKKYFRDRKIKSLEHKHHI